MARLVVKTNGFNDQVIELNLGITRVGRSPENEVRIDHSTISAKHCELLFEGGELWLRDCGSTNGTFLAGKPIKQAVLQAGQIVHLGDVELVVESTDVTIAIPKFEVSRPAPPVVLADGSLICPRHPGVKATHKCTHCREVLCDECVHRLRRRGGKVLKLCPLCSFPCEVIGGEKKPKKSILAFLQKTVKLPFMRQHRR